MKKVVLAGTVALALSGASLAAAVAVGRRSPNAVIVAVFPDGGEKYLSERFWDESRG